MSCRKSYTQSWLANILFPLKKKRGVDCDSLTADSSTKHTDTLNRNLMNWKRINHRWAENLIESSLSRVNVSNDMMAHIFPKLQHLFKPAKRSITAPTQQTIQFTRIALIRPIDGMYSPHTYQTRPRRLSAFLLLLVATKIMRLLLATWSFHSTYV